MKKATFIQILEFINKREVVSAFDLVEWFGYTLGGAYSTLGWLKKEHLVINDRKGEWTITNRGIERLIHYGRLK